VAPLVLAAMSMAMDADPEEPDKDTMQQYIMMATAMADATPEEPDKDTMQQYIMMATAMADATPEEPDKNTMQQYIMMATAMAPQIVATLEQNGVDVKGACGELSASPEEYDSVLSTLQSNGVDAKALCGEIFPTCEKWFYNPTLGGILGGGCERPQTDFSSVSSPHDSMASCCQALGGSFQTAMCAYQSVDGCPE